MADSHRKEVSNIDILSSSDGVPVHDVLTDVGATNPGMMQRGQNVQTSTIVTSRAVSDTKSVKWRWWMAAIILGAALWVGIFSLMGIT